MNKRAFKHIEDSIVTEFPVTIKMNGQEFVTMVSTPEYIEDMVIGFLASEGIIRKYEDIDDIWVQEKDLYTCHDGKSKSVLRTNAK